MIQLQLSRVGEYLAGSWLSTLIPSRQLSPLLLFILDVRLSPDDVCMLQPDICALVPRSARSVDCRFKRKVENVNRTTALV
jgi:hypothetical protein